MSTMQRLLSTAAAFFVAIGMTLVLTLTGPPAEGPIARLLMAVGDAVSTVESQFARRVRGEARAEKLDWLHSHRSSPERLRTTEEVLLGAYDSGIPTTLDGVLLLENALGFPLPLIQIYTAWGDKPDQQFPWRLARAISDIGSIPVITWEPWLSDFDERLHPDLPPRTVRDQQGLEAVARGSYDFYIDRWALDGAAFERPVMVRLAHEMNDAYRYPWGPHHNSAAAFRAAWRHVVDRFRRAGADNVLWVWSPHVAFDGWEEYYPGDDVVDWVATGALNYGNVAYWSRWWTFEEIFGNKYSRLDSYGKPVMIAELGTLAVGGDAAEWYRQALTNLPQKYPRVKAVLFFHHGSDRTVTQQTLSWTFAGNPAVRDAVAGAIRPWARGGRAEETR